MTKRSVQPALAGFEARLDAPQSATLAAAPAPSAPLRETSNPPADRTVYAVDAHNLIYQVFHALPEMSGPSGQPVGAVQGFVRDVLDLIESHGAEYLVCALD